MSTYELDDDVVRALLGNLDLLPPALRGPLSALEAQIPIPAPTRIGAVVRTEPTSGSSKYRTWVLWNLPGLWVTPEDGGGNAYLTREIGRITEVLSEGVDL